MIRCRLHRDRSQRFKFIQIGYESTLSLAAQRMLEYDFDQRSYIRGPWMRTNTELTPGVYCAYCLQDGIDQLLTEDQEDLELEDLLDPVLIFKEASEFRLDEVWPAIEARFGENIVMYRDFPAQPPVYADLDPALNLDPGLQRVLFEKVLPLGGRLYQHQAEALRAIGTGNDVTVVTPTASGKSLIYALPMLDAVLKDPSATILYLAPLNALVEDQLEAFSRFDTSGRDWEDIARHSQVNQYMRTVEIDGRSITIARYDGNVPEGQRQDIRQKHPNIIITNPEMLHWGILSYGSKSWRYLFEHLRFVIIDELHTYRGLFGANFANLMRRVRRLSHHLHATPRFICASATIKNPSELAQALTGRSHTIIGQDRDGSPHHLRRFVLWDATRTDEAINTDASNLTAALIADHRVKTITFARSIPSVDAIHRYVNGRLRDTFDPNLTLFASFKKALMPGEKRRITQDLRSGRLQGVVSTTALKLGIDIGDLSAAIIVKYPGSIADVWQQAGRAGRKGEALIVLMADRDPLNQYFAHHPDDFFAMEPEEVFVDPDNRYILLDQLWCAVKDWPIDLAVDCQFFGPSLPEYLRMLDQEGKVEREAARNSWVLRDRDGFPAKEVPIRAFGFSFDVIDDSGKTVAREDADRAVRYLHKYARYSVQDDIYEVSDLKLDLYRKIGNARVRKLPRPVDYLTQAVVSSESSILRHQVKRTVFGADLAFGEIAFRSQVKAYYKIPLGGRGDRHTKAEYQPLGGAAPPERVFDTTSVWLALPQRFVMQYDQDTLAAGLRSMGRALSSAVTIQEFCDPSDIGDLELVAHPGTGLPTIFLHDSVPGGIGIAEQTYYDFENVFRRAYRILNECPNARTDPDHRGCPLCVTEGWGDESVVNRPIALEIFRAMLGDDPVVERKTDDEVRAILARAGFVNIDYVKSGGMGRIYRGHDGERELAIKVINPVTLKLSGEAVMRMAREASIWKGLIHQNIVHLRQVNQPEGLFYLTMDWMPRGSLRDRLPRHGLNVAEAQRIVRGIAHALIYLHNQGYVHRDVNPNNILFDAADQPRLTDFGIAKSLSDDVGVRTQMGMGMGTYGYQPPEQQRNAVTAGAAADIFALGVVLFELLLGTLPPRDTVGGIPEDALERLPTPELFALIQSMVAIEPEMRPSAAAVVRQLEEATHV